MKNVSDCVPLAWEREILGISVSLSEYEALAKLLKDLKHFGLSVIQLTTSDDHADCMQSRMVVFGEISCLHKNDKQTVSLHEILLLPFIR